MVFIAPLPQARRRVSGAADASKDASTAADADQAPRHAPAVKGSAGKAAANNCKHRARAQAAAVPQKPATGQRGSSNQQQRRAVGGNKAGAAAPQREQQLEPVQLLGERLSAVTALLIMQLLPAAS
jgi:hypothetical protein